MDISKVPVVGQQKKKVTIDVTKHIKTFINYNGEEISRDEAFKGFKASNTGKLPEESGQREQSEGVKKDEGSK